MIAKIIICVLGYGGAIWVIGEALRRNRKRCEQKRRTNIVLGIIDNDSAINWTERAKQRDDAIERGEAA